jgi:hypothetical protein
MKRRKSIPDGVVVGIVGPVRAAMPIGVVGATVILPFSKANKAEKIIVVVRKTTTKTASHRL